MLDLSLLLAQLVVILTAARLAGRMIRVFGQPPVIGEMLAGLLLGPSVLGAFAPSVLARLFPAAGIAPLTTLSQLGVLLFLFVVGLRLDLGVLRGRTRVAIATSQASIAVPFALGVCLAPRLYAEFAPHGVPALPFALFVGAAMSVTAFPVLARILVERGMLESRIGTIALAAAAVDDVTAWCILAAVVAVARAGAGETTLHAASIFATTLLATAVYVIIAMGPARRALARLAARHVPDGVPTPQLVSAAIIVALASAWLTERLGVHALFGAFVAGVVMPRGIDGAPGLATHIADQIEGVVSAALLPVFFAVTGLRTSVALIGGDAWVAFALVLVVAITGKLGGSAVAARWTGLSWRDALSVGVLMNTRGLMELVILGVGLDAGIISPALFAMMVLMALVTTTMTGPLLGWIAGARSAVVSPKFR